MTVIARLKPLLVHETSVRFAKFVAVGLLNTAFSYVVYAAFVLLGIPSQIALALAYACGIVWNYFTHARLVFDHQGFGRMPAYVGAYVLLYGLNALALDLLVDAGVVPLLAQALILPFAAVFSFAMISRVLTGKFPLLG